jgi:hypothetical protein
MAAQSETPDALRILYGKFSRTEVASKGDAKVSDVLKAKAELAFIKEYDELFRRVEENDLSLLNELNAINGCRGPGQGNKTMLLNRVANDLGMENHVFNTLLQRCRGLKQFISFFGQGVLALLSLAGLRR